MIERWDQAVMTLMQVVVGGCHVTHWCIFCGITMTEIVQRRDVDLMVSYPSFRMCSRCNRDMTFRGDPLGGHEEPVEHGDS